MLIQQTLTKLHSLKLSGMAQGFEEQLSNAATFNFAVLSKRRSRWFSR